MTATDLRDYGCPNAQSRIDFLLERRAPVGVEAIITNPPYKLADQFVAHALDLVPKVCMLLRLAFLESERRTSILESGRRARIHVFRDRLPMMHRFGWSGPRATSSIPFAWFVFDHKRGGPTVIDRITARQSSSRAHAATLVPIFIRRHNSNQEENSKCRKLKTQQK